MFTLMIAGKAVRSTPLAVDHISCDIAIAGGSTASLAAALTAAEAAPELSVCFLEITDWPGGQMTAGGVPAIDFGPANKIAANQPKSFRDAMEFIPGDGHDWNRSSFVGSGSPGACSVSTKCYLPSNFVEGWVIPRITRSSNLQLFLRTAVISTSRNPNVNGGAIATLTAVQRSPKPGTIEWSARLSEELPDWYSPVDSTAFSKRSLSIEAKVFIEATELGDVLATSGLPFAQGIESPTENATSYESTCGQAQTLTFYMALLAAAPAKPDPAPRGDDEGMQWPDPVVFVKEKPGPSPSDFQHTWTWRRSWCAGPNRTLFDINVGDVTQQNLGNDLDTAYMFLPLAAARAEARSKEGWRGGLNLTALRMLEDRAYGWFRYIANTSRLIDPTMPARLVLNRSASGTAHGLSKMVYWRDTRRAIGLDGFRLTHPPLHPQPDQTGEKFYDAVALGDYNDDTHHLSPSVCQYPSYIGRGAGEGAKPYYIPLRAMLVGGAPNLLVAGKTMSQSFHANSNTRLHPSEWTSGVAAGGTAVLMVRRNWSDTRSALAEHEHVRAFLNSSSCGQPLEWSDLPPPTPPPLGSACIAFAPADTDPSTTATLKRCVGVDAKAAALAPAGMFFNGSSNCGNSSANTAVLRGDAPDCHTGTCSALANIEWLAEEHYWTSNVTAAGQVILATAETYLKKSTAMSGVLPDNQKLRVDPGFPCRILSLKKFDGYWLCFHHHNQ